MSRRTTASLVSLGLLVVLIVIAARQPVPYVLYEAGPTLDVLGDHEEKPIIGVEGRQVYRDDGDLRLTTVVSSGGPGTKVNLVSAVRGWLDPSVGVIPFDAVYQPEDTRDSVREEATQQMTSSQDTSVAAALRALGIGFEEVVGVGKVVQEGPSDGKLKPGDLVLRVNGKPASTTTRLKALIQAVPPGGTAELTIERKGEMKTVSITTAASPDDPEASIVGVEIRPSYDFPFEVELNLYENIGGPSAGLMFALGTYDVLTPGSLTDGKVIAGTGAIDAEGKVGAIGGIAQKIAGAQRDGARLFLVPADNCKEAVQAHYDEDKIQLVRVATLDEAIKDVEAWTDDSDAQLTRCQA